MLWSPGFRDRWKKWWRRRKTPRPRSRPLRGALEETTFQGAIEAAFVGGSLGSLGSATGEVTEVVLVEKAILWREDHFLARYLSVALAAAAGARAGVSCRRPSTELFLLPPCRLQDCQLPKHCDP